MEEDQVSKSKQDEFMKIFKYYKSNKSKPLLKDVISVDECGSDKVTEFTPATLKEDPRIESLGLRNPKEWQIVTINRNPGLLFIRNPFTALGQRYWIRRCLQEYSKKPNRLNIDIDGYLQDWWTECFKLKKCDRPLQKKLRWATLGYHHDWDTKIYTEENKSPFPEDLAELSDVFAELLGYTDFKAEAAIVNYYHMNSTLSAHTDHSEVNLEAPLFSLSFGQSAIFLIGGKDKSVEPSAILLNSGDVVVMSEEARLCYHAVPKILPAPNSPWDAKDYNSIPASTTKFKYISEPEEIVSSMNENADNENWYHFRNYIQESRINMNVRQVLNKKQNSL
ncbi:unnamed protein product [Chrysodeixis includens]|uniref:Alpha-ketoglutarate-dependent dioxygenase AlkB-like domain-containing protein n=1 Tax=Chrysodeixis includens TaxID=689277 RepID=A0A9P0C0G3_CHRIL|nr:unnamed protein product [Chrysodeixis includens]